MQITLEGPMEAQNVLKLYNADLDDTPQRGLSSVMGLSGKKLRPITKYRSKCIIDPDRAPWLIYWDTCSMLLLFVVSVFVPFESGFLDCPEWWSPIWLFTQLLNMFFLCDFVLQLFLPFPKKTRYGEAFIFRRKLIIKHYCKTWFTIDFISIVPFGWIVSCDSHGRSLGTLRAIRLLRLLKLLRLLRGFRLLKRLQTSAGFSFRRFSLYLMFVSLLMIVHWMACLLGITSRLQGDRVCLLVNGSVVDDGCSVTWITHSGIKGTAPFDTYILALHTSVSILIHPHSQNPTGTGERLIFICLMLLGGFIWTQVISRSTALFTSLDRHNLSYQQTMDDINTICKERCLSADVHYRLRRFFMNSRGSSQDDAWVTLVKRMSPKLRRDVFREVNRFWVIRIRCLQSASISFRTDVAQALVVQAFSEQEHFGEPYNLYMLMAGSALRTRNSMLSCLAAEGKRRVGDAVSVLSLGACWGEEHMLLTNRKLIDSNMAMAVSYVRCQVLTRSEFERIASMHPDHHAMLRKETIRLAVVRGIKYFASELRKMRNPSENRALISEDVDEHLQDSMQQIQKIARQSNIIRDKALVREASQATEAASLTKLLQSMETLKASVELLSKRNNALEESQNELRENVSNLLAALHYDEDYEELSSPVASESCSITCAEELRCQAALKYDDKLLRHNKIGFDMDLLCLDAIRSDAASENYSRVRSGKLCGSFTHASVMDENNTALSPKRKFESEAESNDAFLLREQSGYPESIVSYHSIIAI